MYLRLTVLASLWVVLVAGCMPSAKDFYEEGVREYRLGHYQNAAGCFRSSLERDPEKQEAAYYLARCARNWAETDYSKGEYLSAMRHLDEAIQYYDQAIEAYDLAIRTYPKSPSIPEAHYKRGRSLQSLKQNDAAREAYEAVIKTYPDSPEATLAKQGLDSLALAETRKP